MAEDSLQPEEVGKPYPRSDQDYLLNLIFNDGPKYGILKIGEILFHTARVTGYLEFNSPTVDTVTLRINLDYQESVFEMHNVRYRLRSVLPHIAVRSKESHCEAYPNLYGFEADVDMIMWDESIFPCHILMENTLSSQRLIITRL